jgi:hypothetical protein
MNCFNLHSTIPDAAESQILIQAEAFVVENGYSYKESMTQERSFVEQTQVLIMPVCLCAVGSQPRVRQPTYTTVAVNFKSRIIRNNNVNMMASARTADDCSRRLRPLARGEHTTNGHTARYSDPLVYILHQAALTSVFQQLEQVLYLSLQDHIPL